jgi:site-specific DNA-methyltransferase (adenine-specific)
LSWLPLHQEAYPRTGTNYLTTGGSMTPTIIGKASIYNVDCMEYMATLPDKAFDLSIVDPPYRDQNQPTKDMRNNGSMKSLEGRPTKEYFKELKRVSVNQIIWGANNFELTQFKGFVIWKKMTISEQFTMSMCEIASLSEDLGTVSKWIEIAPQDSMRIHPTQKPVKLYEWLLANYAKPGQRILDTHMGSGSSVIAANNLGFEIVATELDQNYFNAACKRIKQATAQERLFA